MDLRSQFIKLSESRECSKAYSYEGVDNVHFLKLNTLEGEKIGELVRANETEGATAKILVKLICDENGEKIFKDSDVGILNKMPISITSEMLKDSLIYNKILPSNMGKILIGHKRSPKIPSIVVE